MSTMSAKHKELSEQLGTWWRTQTDFKTKKDLAGLLRVHSDTLGEYFSGRSFPRWDIASRLFELTNIECLRPDVGGNSPLEMVPGESPAALLLAHPSGIAASNEEHPEADHHGAIGSTKEERHLEKSPEVIEGQLPGELEEGERHRERSVVISLKRTICPFCSNEIARFRSCAYCGQYFVWANVPLEDDGPMW